MEAFFKNIDALSEKTAHLIQKWEDVKAENDALRERNKQLELNLDSSNFTENKEIEQHNPISLTESNIDLSQIEHALDAQIERINKCIELINKELNGER